MDGTRALVVALLLSLATLGGISVVASQEGSPETNATMSVISPGGTAEYLAPDPGAIDRHGQETVSIDAAGAVSANVGSVRSTFRRSSLQRTYSEATDPEERRSIVRNGTRQLGARIRQLERRETQAVQSYSAGEIGETMLVRKLAVVDEEAGGLGETVEWLAVRADNLGMDDTETELSLYRARLQPLQGPVRSNVADAIGGDGSARVHVDASGEGFVLATLDTVEGDATYVREAYDPSARTDDFGSQSRSGLSAAEDRLRALYPWVTNTSTPTAAPVGPDYALLWRFSYAHPHGSVETYLDVETERILLERQTLDPEEVPTTSDRFVDDDLAVELSRTRAGGPLGITVTDTTTGDPVAADVEIDGDALGSTRASRLWTVAPRGETTINATYRGDQVSYETSFD
jgi:hypothetical protein